MATIITKNSSTSAAAPLTADLVAGELAVNTTDGTLFVGTGTAVVQISGAGVSGSLSTTNTWTASNTFTGGLATSGGTVATLNDIASNAAVAANTSRSTANSAKVGITTAQANAIATNSGKVGITTAQANAIVANSAKVTYTNLKPLTNTWTGSNAFQYVTATSILASGNITAYSDKRLKEKVETIENALDKVVAITGVTFSVIGEDTAARRTGVIAQDVQAVLPEAVQVNEDGLLSVAYGNMVGLLIEAIKEQQIQIDELKKPLKEVN